MIIGIDHGYYAIKTKQVCFPTGIIRYEYEPYTMQNVLQYQGEYYVCGTGRQTLVKDKTANDNYYLLTLAALAQEIRKRKGERTAKVVLAAGLPLTGFGREKQKFKEYLFQKQLIRFLYEGERYEIQIEDVKLFPQGYSALALYPEYLKDEPSVLLVDIGGWTVDLMRLDNAVPNAATCRSLELGVIRCMDEIREQVRRNTGLSVTETQIERVLRGKPSSMPAEVVSLIERQGRLYIEKILSAITEAGFDLRAVPSVFMGGGAAIFKHRVSEQDRLCRPIYLTDVHANAAGYERISTLPDCGADEDAVSRPVFSFRPNLKNPEHEKAWQLLMEIPTGQRNQYLVDVILEQEERETLKRLIQEAVREELKCGDVERMPACEKEEIPGQMLDFLFQMEQE